MPFNEFEIIIECFRSFIYKKGMNKKYHPVYAKAKRIFSPTIWLLAVVLLGLNIALAWVVKFAGITVFYLSDVFTIVAACWLGALPGLFVGMGTTIFAKLAFGASVYSASVPGFNVIIAVFMMRKGLFRKWWSYPLLVIFLALIWGFGGQVFNYYINGQTIDLENYVIFEWLVNEHGWNPFWSKALAVFCWEIVDKAISVFVLWLFFILYPQDNRFLDYFPYTYLLKKPWGSFKKGLDPVQNSKSSIKNKILSITTMSYLILGVMVVAILSSTSHDKIYDEYCDSLSKIAQTASEVVDGDKLDSYFNSDGTIPYEDYDIVKNDLNIISKTDDRIMYVCVFRFEDDKAYAVFDTDDKNPFVLGEEVDIAKSFDNNISPFVKGQEVTTIFRSVAKCGEIMSGYHTIKNSQGRVVAYSVVDFDYRSISVATGITIAQVASVEVIVFLWGGIILYYLLNIDLIAPLQIMNDELSTFHATGVKHWKGSKYHRDRVSWGLQNELGQLSHNIHKTEDEACSTYIEIQERTAKIIAMEAGLVSALAEIVESRDVNTGDHIKRTSLYAKILAKAMAKRPRYKDIITPDYIDTLTTACTLHDVGKISISDSILNKPDKLTPEEFEIMKTHTTVGVKLIDMAIEDVGDNAYLSLGREIAGGHHEKWDGSGYPLGLKEEEIPLSARIMAVVDVFDALTSKRSYKEPFSFEESVNIILEGKGKHFDPEIVDVFISILPKLEKYFKQQ